MGTRRRPPAGDRPPTPAPPRLVCVRCRMRCAWAGLRSSTPCQYAAARRRPFPCCYRTRSAPALAPARWFCVLSCSAILLTGAAHYLCLCRPARLRSCCSRLAANTPGADQRPAPIRCRSSCSGTRAPAPSARLLVSRSAPGACFALLRVVIKRAHADSLQRARRPPASALRPALRL